jgi:ligand-binding SRPBCC domain-containing protein
MTSGRFKLFCHDHYFEPTETGTRMTDVLDFASPFGLLGRLADTLFLAGYLKRLLQRRNAIIKGTAEAALTSPGA